MTRIKVQPFYHWPSKTHSYVVSDPASKQAAVLDPALDVDFNSGTLSTQSADEIIAFLDENNLQLQWLLETYAHTSRLTAAQYLKQQRGGHIGISEHIAKVQSTFKKTFNFAPDMPCDGRDFDYLFQDDEVFYLGHIAVHAIATPGHTPACMSYQIDEAIFVGSALLMPECGTARTDFPCSSAKASYQSIQRILALPDATRMFVGQDDVGLADRPRSGHKLSGETSVLRQKRDNVHLHGAMTESVFTELRAKLDANLPSFQSLLPIICANLRAGCLPQEGLRLT